MTRPHLDVCKVGFLGSWFLCALFRYGVPQPRALRHGAQAAAGASESKASSLLGGTALRGTLSGKAPGWGDGYWRAFDKLRKRTSASCSVDDRGAMVHWTSRPHPSSRLRLV